MERALKDFVRWMEKWAVRDDGNGPYWVEEACERISWRPETCSLHTQGCDDDPENTCCQEHLELFELYQAAKELVE
jgi:hypothetical protein